MSRACSPTRRNWPLERVLFALSGTVTLFSACPASLILARVLDLHSAS